MKLEDVDLLVTITEARRNAIWASQGQNSYQTNLQIDRTLLLIEQVIKTIQKR